MSVSYKQLPSHSREARSKEPTDRQRAIFDYAFAATMRQCRPPTMQEIADALGGDVTVTTINNNLIGLVKKGWLAKDGGKARGLRFLKGPDGLPFRGFVVTYPEA